MSEVKAKIIKEHRIACITTNSLKEIMNLFPNGNGDSTTYNITRLRANASLSQADAPLIDDKLYGVVGFLNKKIDTFSIDYSLKFDENGNETNPIDRSAIKKIEGYLNQTGVSDAAVEYLQVLIRDSKIGELAGIDQDLFHATLVSDPVDGDLDRAIINEHEVNKYLIKECGFKYRILHTRKLIDRKSELTLPKRELLSKYLINWVGYTIYSMKSPIKIAVQLKGAHYGEYKLIKRYGEGMEDTLVLLGVNR